MSMQLVHPISKPRETKKKPRVEGKVVTTEAVWHEQNKVRKMCNFPPIQFQSKLKF